jgi:Fe-S-cluster-containing dehydrogenase component/CRP-like cAMP-binding protein
MPRIHESRRETLQAIQSSPSLSPLASIRDGRYQYELDLEIIVFGKNYNGRKIGPYLRLLTYEPGETIIREGDWGGNHFYLLSGGRAEVFVKSPESRDVKISEALAGAQVGEISVLAGAPHSTTVRAPMNETVQALEIDRPALRLLRKIPGFSQSLDRSYLGQGLKSAFQKINLPTELCNELLAQPRGFSQFKIFAKNHVLFREESAAEFLYVIQDGWLRRSEKKPDGEKVLDFMGPGHCYGFEGSTKRSRWAYTATLLGRSEILLISLAELDRKPALRDALLKELARFAAPSPVVNQRMPGPAGEEQIQASQEKLIRTGLVDGTNLLVMDMDLCVRCGRCSLACHQIQGRSRLLRRGVTLTRLEGMHKKKIQQILAPQACLHCKDPECLTGCPTGAINRLEFGQIDINFASCIGCGDCATNCPYNVISMVPRKLEEPEKLHGLEAMKRRLSVAPEPPPARAEQTTDLLALKCNLCIGAAINPPGCKSHVYGCEENCPTGALARINPRDYFSEIKQIEGGAFVDRPHGNGRNFHRSDPLRKLMHLGGLLFLILSFAGAAMGIERYGLETPFLGFFNMQWITGIAGLLGVGATMTYPIRTRIYKRRAGPLRYWMLAHAYLGAATGVILLLHGGAESGGPLTIALRVAFDLTILTGCFGFVCYYATPRLLTRIEGSPLLLEDLISRRTELQEEISNLISRSSETFRQALLDGALPRLLSFAFLLRQFVKQEKLESMLAAAREEFIRPYPEMNPEEKNRLSSVIEAAATLRRVEALIFLHRLLKAWLPPHVIFTSLMLALMILHIIRTLI